VEGLTEPKYKEIIDNLISSVPADSKVAFMVSVKGDIHQWSDKAIPVLTPDSPEAMSEIISSAKCLISARLHPGLMAAMHGVNVLAIAYHHKFSILEEFEIPVIWGCENSGFSSVSHASEGNPLKLLAAAERTENALKQLILGLT
jgi:polysaccharide pyruvyl transferase WcaK-like protein